MPCVFPATRIKTPDAAFSGNTRECLFLHIGKSRVLRQPYQVDGSDRTVSLLGYDDFGDSFHFTVFIVIIITVNEHYNVGILLDGSGLSKVG